MAFLSLVIKRVYFERPQRPWDVWCMDVGKNAGAQIAAHFVNLFSSFTLATSHKHRYSGCSWYMVAFIADVTFGVALAYLLLRLSVSLAKECRWERLQRHGDYGQVIEPQSGRLIVPPDSQTFALQTFVWVCVCVVRAFPVFDYPCCGHCTVYSPCCDGAARML